MPDDWKHPACDNLLQRYEYEPGNPISAQYLIEAIREMGQEIERLGRELRERDAPPVPPHA